MYIHHFCFALLSLRVTCCCIVRHPLCIICCRCFIHIHDFFYNDKIIRFRFLNWLTCSDKLFKSSADKYGIQLVGIKIEYFYFQFRCDKMQKHIILEPSAFM